MALAFTNLTFGEDATDPGTSASISPAAGSMVYCGVVMFRSDNEPEDSLSVSGCGLTWVQLAFTELGASNRSMWLFRGTGTPSAGAVTMDYTGAGTIEEIVWSIDQVTGHSASDPDDAPVTGATNGTSLTLADVGTPGVGDGIYCVFGTNENSADFNLQADFTTLGHEAGTAQVQIKSGYDITATLDETPGVTTSTAGRDIAGIGLIVNVAASSPSPTPSPSVSPSSSDSPSPSPSGGGLTIFGRTVFHYVDVDR